MPDSVTFFNAAFCYQMRIKSVNLTPNSNAFINFFFFFFTQVLLISIMNPHKSHLLTGKHLFISIFFD